MHSPAMKMAEIKSLLQYWISTQKLQVGLARFS